MAYVASIGLEVHVQLKTRTKIWCGCPNQYGEAPNTLVCPVCLGYPGAMPVLNEEAVRLTVMTGLMIGCEIGRYSKFDRKNYFYPDQAKNYQISQYDQPLCLGGTVTCDVDGAQKTVNITRIHLEEDVAKNTHHDTCSSIDFNRAGTPLMEIVSEPDMQNEDEAFAFLQALKQILVYGGISDCNLEQGNLRCDINVSVRPEGQSELGTKVEIKNMNTFKGVHRSLKAEIKRQKKALDKGEVILQETRRWDDAAGVTLSMRSKEYAHDYRYFPEPDLVPVTLSEVQISGWASSLPEMPAERRKKLIDTYGLPEYDAGVLTADKAVVDFFEETAALCSNAKAVSNWIMTEVLRSLSEKEVELRDVALTSASLAELIKLVDEKVINMTSAKEIFNELFDHGGDPRQIVEEKGMAQVSDSSAIDEFVSKAIDEHPKSVSDYKSGKEAALQFLVGQVMRFSKGKANPQLARDALKAKLDA